MADERLCPCQRMVVACDHSDDRFGYDVRQPVLFTGNQGPSVGTRLENPRVGLRERNSSLSMAGPMADESEFTASVQRCNESHGSAVAFLFHKTSSKGNAMLGWWQAYRV